MLAFYAVVVTNGAVLKFIAFYDIYLFEVMSALIRLKLLAADILDAFLHKCLNYFSETVTDVLLMTKPIHVTSHQIKYRRQSSNFNFIF